MSPRPQGEQDSTRECPLVEILQHTCPSEEVDGVRRYVCYPIPRIFRVCEGKPAVEMTKFVHIDVNTGQVELPKCHPVPQGKLWSQVKRYPGQ